MLICLPDISLIDISLEGHGVTVGQVGIRSKPGLPHLPIVIVVAIEMELWRLAETHGVGAIVKVLAVAAVADSSASLIDVASVNRGVRSLGVFCILSDNVDHAIDGIRSPDRPARPAN
jgi:hypothetical protein